MKRYYLIFVIIFLICNLQAQNVVIPDTAFLNALISNGIDTDRDGQISISETESVTYLNLEGDINKRGNISDLTGIEAFDNLKELKCSYNNLTSLDLSRNPRLRELNCSHNQISNLDISGLYELDKLVCGYNQLSELDLSLNGSLEILILGAAEYLGFGGWRCINEDTLVNNFTDISLSSCTELVNLFCSATPIKTLDLRANTKLAHIGICSMDSLTQVCVWNSFYADVYVVDDTNCPNVSFKRDCPEITSTKNTKNHTIKLYPNPANKMLNIEIPNSFKNNYTIEISNILGKLVYHKVYQANRNQLLNHIDISTYSKGIYIVRCNYKHHTLTRKVVFN